MKNKQKTTLISKEKSRGFTIIEMLIAVLIFTIAISALTFMAGRGIRSARESQQRIIAEYLASEGMEVVRNIRDTAFLAGLNETSWTGVFGGDITGPGGCFNTLEDQNQEKTCEFNYTSEGIPELDICTSCTLFLDSTTKIYQYESGLPTPFVREIFINEITPTEIKVKVRVIWGNESIEYQEHLFLWG